MDGCFELTVLTLDLETVRITIPIQEGVKLRVSLEDAIAEYDADMSARSSQHRELGEALGHNCAQTVLAQVRAERARRGVDDAE